MTIYRPHRGGTTKMNTGSGKDIVLPEGELFVEYSDDGITAGKVKFKLGDGVSTYNELPYAIGDTRAGYYDDLYGEVVLAGVYLPNA